MLAPRKGTPCLTACDDPASPSCQDCCRTVTHEIDWGCDAPAGSANTASCCKGAWDPTCWNTASAANHEHACNQCRSVSSDDFYDFFSEVLENPLFRLPFGDRIGTEGNQVVYGPADTLEVPLFRIIKTLLNETDFIGDFFGPQPEPEFASARVLIEPEPTRIRIPTGTMGDLLSDLYNTTPPSYTAAKGCCRNEIATINPNPWYNYGDEEFASVGDESMKATHTFAFPVFGDYDAEAQCQLACDLSNERAHLPDSPAFDTNSGYYGEGFFPFTEEDFPEDFDFDTEFSSKGTNNEEDLGLPLWRERQLERLMGRWGIPPALYGRQCAGFELSRIKKKKYKCSKTELQCSVPPELRELREKNPFAGEIGRERREHEGKGSSCGANNYCDWQAHGQRNRKSDAMHRCELHFSPITHSKKGSRSCKRAKCHAREDALYGVLQVPAFANDPIIDLKFGMEEDPSNFKNSIVIPVTPRMPDCPAFVNMEDSKWHELIVVRTVNESAPFDGFPRDVEVSEFGGFGGFGGKGGKGGAYLGSILEEGSQFVFGLLDELLDDIGRNASSADFPPFVEEPLIGNYSIERLSPFLQRVTRLDGPLDWNQTFTITCGRKDPYRNWNFTALFLEWI